jgi:hypothetical protein
MIDLRIGAEGLRLFPWGVLRKLKKQFGCLMAL